MAATSSITVLHGFNYTDGQYPEGHLAQGSDGAFYGVTEQGGSTIYGTTFKVTTSGVFTSLHSFTGDDGDEPTAGLLLGTDGNFYGTTSQGINCVNSSCTSFGGTVFKMTPGGTVVTLHSFNDLNGGYYPGALTDGGDGSFYGTTNQGGANDVGVAFKITPSGTYTQLASFGNAGQGSFPAGGLTLGSDGNFYGATKNGGSSNLGTIFRLTPAGAITTVHSFDGTDGSSPLGSLLLNSDGSFYGTAGSGGAGGAGTVFKITTSGTLTTLVSFNGGTGVAPLGVVKGADGNYYGVTGGGGNLGYGTLFQLTPAGDFITLHLFTPADGTSPSSVPVLGTDSKLYGTTVFYGGSTGASGSVYQFDPTYTEAPVLNLSKTCYNEQDTCSRPFNTVAGGTVSIDWSSSRFTSCTASGAWSGTKPTGGEYKFAATKSGIYKLSCTGPNGSASASVSLTVLP